MDRMAAGLVLVAAATVVALVLGPGRDRIGGARDPVLAVAGACMGIGGLLMIDDVGFWSWVAAPVFLATATVVQARMLFAPGGPFRT